MADTVTLHLGSRAPKLYYTEKEAKLLGIEFTPGEPPLQPEQPQGVKCRVKIRISKDSTFAQALNEIWNDAWRRQDHGNPAWVASTDPFFAKVVSQMYGGIEIREWQPAEGDD